MLYALEYLPYMPLRHVNINGVQSLLQLEHYIFKVGRRYQSIDVYLILVYKCLGEKSQIGVVLIMAILHIISPLLLVFLHLLGLGLVRDDLCLLIEDIHGRVYQHLQLHGHAVQLTCCH